MTSVGTTEAGARPAPGGRAAARPRGLASTLAAGVLLACAEPTTRPASFAELAFETVAPPGWAKIGQEMTNRRSHFSLKIEDLTGAEQDFLAGLPGSIEPELTRWTLHYFGNATLGARVDTTVGGLPARLVEFTAVSRPGQQPTHVRYWVVRRGVALYLFRAVLSPGRLESDAAAVDAIVAGIRFLPLLDGIPASPESDPEPLILEPGDGPA